MQSEALAYKKEWQAAQQSRLDSGVEADSFVYLHVNADDGVPHHVGIGFKKGRPWETGRNNKHRNKVAKHGLRVEIVADNLTWEQACFWEVHWIKALRSAGYELTNLTDGGEGTLGYRRSEEEKELFRQINTSPEIIAAHRERMLGDKNPMKNPDVSEAVAKKNRGRKHSAESIEASASKRRGVAKTKEQKLASGAGVKRNWDGLTAQERKERGKKRKAAHDKRTPEERSAVGHKGWETRRRNKLLKEGNA